MESEQKFGKYFGICASFHHSKACLCTFCPQKPIYGNMMYCAKGSCPTYGSGNENGDIGTIYAAEEENKNGNENTIATEGEYCSCSKCAVYKQFAMEGLKFCKQE